MKKLRITFILLTSTILSFGQGNWSKEFGFGLDCWNPYNPKFTSQHFEPRFSFSLNKRTGFERLELIVRTSYDRYAMSDIPPFPDYHFDYEIRKSISNRIELAFGQRTQLLKSKKVGLNFITTLGIIQPIFSRVFKDDVEDYRSGFIHSEPTLRTEVGLGITFQFNELIQFGLSFSQGRFFDENINNLRASGSMSNQNILTIYIRK